MATGDAGQTQLDDSSPELNNLEVAWQSLAERHAEFEGALARRSGLCC